MRILVAPDSFKGSLDAAAAARAIARGLAGHDLDLCPLSDGGEGFLAAIGGEPSWVDTTDAIGRPIRAPYVRRGGTVTIELASAAGLTQVPVDRRDPLRTTTWGVGTLIAAAAPFERLVLALGGSATVDGGAGLLMALGARLLDAAGQPIPLGGGGLSRLAALDLAPLAAVLRGADVVVATDVTNPLLGPRGAAPIFGPQKGADAQGVRLLADGLGAWAQRLAEATGVQVGDLPGGGAAGGVAAGLMAALGARCVPGFDLVADAVGLDARLAGCDLVVTGEGQLDETSAEGKVVGRLAARCRAAGVPLVALVGGLTAGGEARLAALGGAAMAIVSGPMALDAACRDAEALLEAAAARLMRLRA